MPAYKYTLKNGKTKWYANFYYTDWTGERKHVCKRGFDTQREAKAYERSFMDQEKTSSDILFSSLVENYMEDMGNRLKPTTMENKRNIIDSKLLPYFSRLKVCEIDTIRVRKWQNELISCRNRPLKAICTVKQGHLNGGQGHLYMITKYQSRVLRIAGATSP